MKQVRCAIYTRKSSKEGLEQDFTRSRRGEDDEWWKPALPLRGGQTR